LFPAFGLIIEEFGFNIFLPSAKFVFLENFFKGFLSWGGDRLLKFLILE